MSYKYVVIVGKRFVSGAMQGMQHEQTVPFPDWESAEKYRLWAMEHTKQPVETTFGSSHYTVEYAILEAR